jgi:hypothetical protein
VALPCGPLRACLYRPASAVLLITTTDSISPFRELLPFISVVSSESGCYSRHQPVGSLARFRPGRRCLLADCLQPNSTACCPPHATLVLQRATTQRLSIRSATAPDSSKHARGKL